MIDPDGLRNHAEQLANGTKACPMDVALRDGISAACFPVLHDLTGCAVSHLIGCCSRELLHLGGQG